MRPAEMLWSHRSGGGEVFILEEGETLIMPKDVPHAVFGEERFKMQLTVSF